jgi:hypothetical protein
VHMKLSSRGRGIVWVIVGVLVVGTVALLTAVHMRQTYRDSHPLSDSKQGFQLLVPRMLPDGYHITGKRIAVQHRNSKQPRAITSLVAELNLGAHTWIYSIQESRHQGEATTTSRTDYDPVSTQKTCKQAKTPKGQVFVLCHQVDYLHTSVYIVTFAKGATFVTGAFPSTSSAVVSELQIRAFVDSFAPGSPAGIPLLVDAV